jgi:predicted O-linked N-acetylglucosamine transferase (SPINDLY family)
MNRQLQSMLQQVIQAFQSENFDFASSTLNKSLQVDISGSETIFDLGLAYAEANKLAEALTIFYCLKTYKNSDARIPYNMGIIYTLEGRRELALEAYDLTLKLQPDYVEALINKGAIHNEMKNHLLALEVLDRAINLNENYYEAYSNKGNALHELKRYDEAIAHYDKAVSLKPHDHEAWINKGATLHELKRYDEAIAHYDKALSLKPDDHEAWINKGATLHKLKRYEEAIAHCDKLLTLKSDDHEASSCKGMSLHELKRYGEAIAHYDRALSFKPDYAEGWLNKGVTLHELKRYEEAIAHYDRALSFKPDYAEGWLNKGMSLHELKRYEEAIAHYEKVLSLKPDADWVYGDLVYTKMKICSWSGLADSLAIIYRKLMVSERAIQPFPLLALSDDGLLQKKSSEIYAQNKFLKNLTLGPIHKRSPQEKLRIGYFSADFRNHAVSILTAELFELHDKNKFEIIAFSFGADDKSLMRLRLTKAFNQFIDTSGMSDMEIAKLSRDLQIDIAIDLGGYTADNRPAIYAYRAAPIQVSYIGYLGTSGTDFIDYLMADKILVSEELQKFYSESIVYLPSYQANDRKRTISDRKFTRTELGLPETSFVFCCFNNNYKILPATFDGWMRILKAVEESVLFLYVENELAEENLRKEAEARGINSARLVFGRRVPNDEYLARYKSCDLFLDTFPYNAGTTASDALWAGIPVLTLKGQSFASRVAASLLNAIGLPELITNTQEEYESLAIELAMNHQKLADIKLRLANNRLTAPLFNTPLFTKNLEAAYIAMYERYQADLEPEHLSIT